MKRKLIASLFFLCSMTLFLLGFAQPHHHSIKMQWSASPTQSVTYNVYRAEFSQQFSKVASGLQSLSYDDQTVAARKTYSYYVTATSTLSGLESVPSNTVTDTVP